MKDFVSKWGISFKDILSIPREEFSKMWGERFLEMPYCEFRRTIKRETPHMKENINLKNTWQKDRLINKLEYKATQIGVWDCDKQGDLI